MLQDVSITAHVRDGFTVQNDSGEPLRVALIDSVGGTVASGPSVSKALMLAAVEAYNGFWQGCGSMRVIECAKEAG